MIKTIILSILLISTLSIASDVHDISNSKTVEYTKKDISNISNDKGIKYTEKDIYNINDSKSTKYNNKNIVSYDK